MGRLWLAAGRVNEALTELERAARLAPGSAEIWFALAQARDRAGRKAAAAQARAAFQRLQKLRQPE
jgi:Flp pilus assembly protein TadD